MMHSSDASPPRLHRWFSALLDLLYPPHCVACGRLGDWLCDECLETIPFIKPPTGQRCGTPIGRTGLCAACQRNTSHLTGIRSVAAHAPPLLQAVHALKYEGLRALAEPLGHLLADHWQHGPLPVDVIAPVPLHDVRRRQRGYNQSVLLARAFGRRVRFPLHEDLLIRDRNTRSQVGLSREERWANVWGAFRCRSGDAKGKRVLLLDDVMTTGATLEACAYTLLEAGAGEVWALTLTRAITPQRVPLAAEGTAFPGKSHRIGRA